MRRGYGGGLVEWPRHSTAISYGHQSLSLVSTEFKTNINQLLKENQTS